MTPLVGEVVEHADAAELARSAAADLVRVADEAIRARGSFSVALTGGSSPVEMYRMLAREPLVGRVPWSNVHLFWGDDRAVPPGHPRSNYRLAARSFIGQAPVPPANVHRIRGELGVRRAADLYAAELREFHSGLPRFDLVLLGLGDDGHVASLFPFDREILDERERVAVPSLHRGLGEWRVTLTVPVLRAARRIEFLLPHAAKGAIARVAMRGPLDPTRIPAQGVRPRDGVLLWRVTHEVVAAGGAPARRD